MSGASRRTFLHRTIDSPQKNTSRKGAKPAKEAEKGSQSALPLFKNWHTFPANRFLLVTILSMLIVGGIDVPLWGVS
ncbi:hypothetical protein Pan258_59620 [Symmachiella dynata]|uniref:Uncharacterized protein n=1 Tax=Symmachiella dynata TaxID=2527995 RepID=A0A517ZYJ6_9PLAN|nr:hypothetical protein Pan258_59620 [Symmachiella dynata]QDU47565.1 hypothetical protein Mal52_61000 [Symmachiella dynata]